MIVYDARIRCEKRPVALQRWRTAKVSGKTLALIWTLTSLAVGGLFAVTGILVMGGVAW